MDISKKGTLTIDNNLSEIGPSLNLIAWYPLNENVEDYTENRYNGTNSGAILVSDSVRKSYEFDGESSYITTNKRFDFEANESFTASCWVNPKDHSDKSTAAAGILGKGHWYANTWDIFLYNNHTARFELSGDLDNDGRAAISSTTLPLEEWSHLTATYDKGEMRFYLNGVSQGSRSYSGDEGFTGNRDVRIGMRHTDTWRILEGRISDVRIYNRALSSEEVAILYQITNPHSPQKILQSKDGTLYVKGELKEN